MTVKIRLAVFAALLGLACSAYAFDPLFFVTDLKGSATITAPDSKTAVPLVANKAYMHGSKIETALASEVRVSLEGINGCTIGAASIVTVQQGGGTNKHLRMFQVEKGVVSVRLGNEFNKDNSNRVTIETLGGIAEPVSGGVYDCTVTLMPDESVAEYAATSGEMKMYDNCMFSIPAMRNENRVALAVAYDKNFVRMTGLKGRYLVDLSNLQSSDGTPKVIEMHPDVVLKMRRKRLDAGDVMAVTILHIDSKGILVNSFSYNSRVTR